MCKPSSISPLDLEKKPDLGQIIMTRTYKLITPLFGGGVKAKQFDDITPIRGSAIRGQLRFWWRATRGGQFGGDLEAMKEAEDAIWGSTNSASKVSISVKTLDHGTIFVVDKKDKDGKHLNIGDPASDFGYVAFPLRPTEHEEAGSVRDGIKFEVTFIFKNSPQDLQDGVQAALWAWETFGGIGARTRRGFGALNCTQVRVVSDMKKQDETQWSWSLDSQTAEEDLMVQVDSFVRAGKFPRGVPHLSREARRYKICVFEKGAHKQQQAWVYLIGKLKAFRQNMAGKRGFGRSNWPEPDFIKDIIKWNGEKFNYDDPVHGEVIKKFPRAQIGLPIVFEFHPEQSDPQEKDIYPPKMTLTGEEFNRLASPLIIRPYQCRDQIVGLAVVLEGSRPWHYGSQPEDQGRLALRKGSGDDPIEKHYLSSKIDEDEWKLIQDKLGDKDAKTDLANRIAAMMNLSQDKDDNPDILQSFLNFLSRSDT